MTFEVLLIFMSWVMRRVLRTSNGHEMKPAMMAATAPLKEQLTVGDKSRQFFYLRCQKMGSWRPENTISLAKVELQPVQKPPKPLCFAISTKECSIFSERPTISCCFTTQKGFLTKLPNISAHTDASTFLTGLSGMAERMDSQTKKKVKEQGKDTIIWHENPLNLLLAIDLKFSPGEEPMIWVLIVSRGQKNASTAMPAIPPAIPCFKSAIIIFDRQNQYSLESTCPNFHRQLLKHAFSLPFRALSSNLTHFLAQICSECLRALQSWGYISRKASTASIFCCLVSRKNSIQYNNYAASYTNADSAIPQRHPPPGLSGPSQEQTHRQMHLLRTDRSGNQECQGDYVQNLWTAIEDRGSQGPKLQEAELQW